MTLHKNKSNSRGKQRMTNQQMQQSSNYVQNIINPSLVEQTEMFRLEMPEEMEFAGGYGLHEDGEPRISNEVPRYSHYHQPASTPHIDNEDSRSRLDLSHQTRVALEESYPWTFLTERLGQAHATAVSGTTTSYLTTNHVGEHNHQAGLSDPTQLKYHLVCDDSIQQLHHHRLSRDSHHQYHAEFSRSNSGKMSSPNYDGVPLFDSAQRHGTDLLSQYNSSLNGLGSISTETSESLSNSLSPQWPAHIPNYHYAVPLSTSNLEPPSVLQPQMDFSLPHRPFNPPAGLVISGLDDQDFQSTYHPMQQSTSFPPVMARSNSSYPIVEGHGIASASSNDLECECGTHFRGSQQKNIRSNYKRHLKGQSAGCHYCRLCGKNIRREDNLRIHNRRHHQAT